MSQKFAVKNNAGDSHPPRLGFGLFWWGDPMSREMPAAFGLGVLLAMPSYNSPPTIYFLV